MLADQICYGKENALVRSPDVTRVRHELLHFGGFLFFVGAGELYI
jgi:hypothetical protein